MTDDRWGIVFLHQKALGAYIDALEEYQREKLVYGFVGSKVAARLDFASKELGRVEALMERQSNELPMKEPIPATVAERRKSFKIIPGGKK